MPWARSRSVLVRAQAHEALDESDVVERVLASVRAVRCAQAEANSRVASLDIEGAEYDALSTFPFTKYQFTVMTVERPQKRLRDHLRKNGYVYVKDLDCTFGEQLWVHGSFANKAARKLGLAPLDPSRDMAECCADPSKGRPASSIDSGCCGTSNTAECNAGAAPVFSKGR